jgi:hypothetical protein
VFLSQDDVAGRAARSQPMPTIFRRQWDDGAISSWQPPDADEVCVIKSSGYDLAWTRVGRRDATKPDEFFIR